MRLTIGYNDTLGHSSAFDSYAIFSIAIFTARCTLVQSAVLLSHVVCLSVRLSICLSVRPSVTLVDCDHIGRNSWKIISPLVSPGCSLFALSNGAIAIPLRPPLPPKSGFHMPQKYANGHICATGDPIHFMFGSRVGFSGSPDPMALFTVRTNPRWRPPPCWKNFKWRYLRNRLSDPLHVWL